MAADNPLGSPDSLPERVADGDYPVADSQFGGKAYLERGKVPGVYLEYRQVIELVGKDGGGINGVSLSVLQGNGDGVRPGDYVVIGQDDAAFIQDPSGTGPLLSEGTIEKVKRYRFGVDGDDGRLDHGDNVGDAG